MLAGVTETMFFPGLIHRLAEDRLSLGGSIAPVVFWGFGWIGSGWVCDSSC